MSEPESATGRADAALGEGSRGWRRLIELLGVIAIVAFVVVPPLPKRWGGALSVWMVDATRRLSIKQGWSMYAPDPQRSSTHLVLTAVDPDGTERPLEEAELEPAAWGVHWAGNKSRRDIWRTYTTFGLKKRNEHRIWYMRGVCVREARRGAVPHRIIAHAVRRRFASPEKVRAGAPGLGPPKRTFVGVEYCASPVAKAMIEADRSRRGETVAEAE